VQFRRCLRPPASSGPSIAELNSDRQPIAEKRFTQLKSEAPWAHVGSQKCPQIDSKERRAARYSHEVTTVVLAWMTGIMAQGYDVRTQSHGSGKGMKRNSNSRGGDHDPSNRQALTHEMVVALHLEAIFRQTIEIKRPMKPTTWPWTTTPLWNDECTFQAISRVSMGIMKKELMRAYPSNLEFMPPICEP
jgi:hypothetical protein